MTNKNRHPFLSLLGLGAFFFLSYDLMKKSLRGISLKKKVVVLYGESRGLNLEIGKNLVAEGALLCLVSKDDKELHRAKNLIQFDHPEAVVQYFVGNPQNLDEAKKIIAEIYRRFAHIDILINNAGTMSVSPFINDTAKEFQSSLQLHFWEPYFMIEAALPYFHSEGRGRILNICSIGSKLGLPHLAPFSAGTAALMGYSKTLRSELLRENIIVTTTYPGIMKTGATAQVEYAWYPVKDSLPFIESNFKRISQKIVSALKSGHAEVTLSRSGKVALAFQTVFPDLHSDIMAISHKISQVTMSSPEPTNEKLPPSFSGKKRRVLEQPEPFDYPLDE